MNKQEFEKRKRTIWSQWENNNNGVRVPDNVCAIVERTANIDWAGRDDIDEEAIECLRGSINDFMKVALAYSEYCQRRTVQHQPEAGPEADVRKVYRKPLERRLYLVEFVAERVITFRNLINRSFIPHHRRIPWKKFAEVWNKTHLYNTFTADHLRTEFYRIIRDRRVQREYFDRREKEFIEFASEGMRKEATMFAEAVVPIVGEDFDVTDEPLKEVEQAMKRWGLQPAPHSRRGIAFQVLLLHKALEDVKAKYRQHKE